MEQSSGRSWVFVVVSREIWDLRDGTPLNKEKPFQTRKNLSKQEKTPTNKGNTFRARETPFKQEKYISGKETPFKQGYLPIKCKSLQVVGVSRQGKAVVSDGGYGVIGG